MSILKNQIAFFLFSDKSKEYSRKRRESQFLRQFLGCANDGMMVIWLKSSITRFIKFILKWRPPFQTQAPVSENTCDFQKNVKENEFANLSKKIRVSERRKTIIEDILNIRE